MTPARQSYEIFSGLDQMLAALRSHGAKRVYAKILAPNDNSKNQPYFGGDFQALNIIPCSPPTVSQGSHGTAIFKAPLNLWWLSGDGRTAPAPSAQLILYPQYPEVRLSGYLQGATIAPSSLMGAKARIPGRILFLGIRPDGRIFAHVVGPESRIGREFRKLGPLPVVGVFHEVPLGPVLDSRTELLRQLCRVARAGWIDSRRLRTDGSAVDCGSPNCGGYTLEAELGVTPNGFSEPDFLGWEVKQHAVSNFRSNRGGPITLLTPEPTRGLYATKGVLSFLERYGYEDRLGRPDRLNFGGTHRVGIPCASTGLTMRLVGFDQERGKITDAGGGVTLIDKWEKEAATWPFSGLLTHWNRKHAQAVFVRSMSREEPRRQYRYSGNVELGVGTEFLQFLKALAQGVIYYDPGIKVEGYPARPRIKRRSQFRIKASGLRALYRSFESVDACTGATSIQPQDNT